ncbi:sensor histidine kinase [Cryobacterium adonitolivorans]|nr:HAMP domain-containing sensor histidine kinase [Cryobacterium adonitolivorans]
MLAMLLIVGGMVFALVSASVAESAGQTLATAAGLDSPQDAPEGTYVSIVDGTRMMSSPSLPSGLLDAEAIESVSAGGADERSRRAIDGQHYLMLTTTQTGRGGDARVVQVAVNQHENDEELNRLRAALLVAGIVALAVSAIAAYWMARRAIRPLADALALQRRFVADASHELRTPLTLLTTRAQLLRRRDQTGVPADVTDAVDEIVSDSRALTGILDDLLIAADPRSVAEPIPVDLAATADRAIALLQDEASAHSVTLRRDGSSKPVIVSGSQAALLRLVVALTTNAIDHASAAVIVTITQDNRQAIARVTDDGAGFAPDIVENAFDRFASSRSTRGERTKNSRHYGLGLSIVAEITRRHQGNVTIDSSAGSGAAVIVRIPLRLG